jgi:hypothetical protein
MTNLPTLSIADIEVRQDSQGRYSMNDLHRAAGGEKRHQPSNWLQNQQTQELIAEIASPGIPGDEQNQPVAAKAGAPETGGGTYVVKELVYAYAMWISPAFHLKVIRAYDALATGRYEAPALAPTSTRPHAVQELLLIARHLARDVPGIDKALAHAVALDAIETATGLPARLMARALPTVSVENAATMNATQLGEALGGFTARAVGIMLVNAGWREKGVSGDWVLTEAGKPYGEMKPYHRNGHSGYELRWKPAAVHALQALQLKDAA